MNRIRFTDAKVRDIAARGVPGRYRDDKTRGFFIEVNRFSSSYKVQTTSKTRKTLRHTIGRVNEMTLEAARQRAEQLLGQIHSGDLVSPVQLAPAKSAMTLEDAVRAFSDERKNARRNAVHTGNIQANIRNHLGDWLSLPIEKITRQMVLDRHARVGERSGPYAANHTMKNLRAVLNAQPDLLSNPVRRVPWLVPPPKLDEHGHELAKGMSLEELPEWWREVKGLTNPVRRSFHMLQLLSGMRAGHLKAARWAWVHPDYIHFPKLKAGRPFKLPLSAPMRAILEELRKLSDGQLLFPAASKSGHLFDVREDALVTGHALRHTYVTVARAAPIPDDHRRLLVDHTIPGIHGQYGRLDAVFPELLKSQELMSSALYFEESSI